MKNYIEAFTIFAKYSDKNYALSAEHDQIWIDIKVKDIHPHSDDGRRLDELGWMVDGWSEEENAIEDLDEDAYWTRYV